MGPPRTISVAADRRSPQNPEQLAIRNADTLRTLARGISTMVCMRAMDDRAAHADEYRRRKEARRDDVAAAERRSQALSWARVVAFALAVAATWAGATHRAPGSVITVPVAGFILLVVVHERAERA